MWKFIKKTLKIVSITVLLLLIALVSIPFLFKDQIKAKVLKTIDEHVNAEVNFSDISFSSFRNFPHLSITLHDACVTGINEFKGDTLLMAKELSASFDVKSILKGDNLEINSIHLENPLLYARILPNGKANYNIVKPDTLSNDTTHKSFKILIDEWRINNGRIVYDDRLQKTYIDIGGLYHSGSGDFQQDISDLDIETKVSDLTVVYNDITFFKKKLFAADITMEMDLRDKKFIFKDHSFQLGNFKFGFDGYFQLLENGYKTDLTFVVKETSFKNLLSLLPGIYQEDLKGIETAGEFSCDGFIRGIYDIKSGELPAYKLDLRVHDAMFKYSHLPEAVKNIKFHLLAENPDGHPEHSSFDLKTFHFMMGKDPVHGRILVKGAKTKQVHADIKLAANLAELEKFYPIQGLTLKGELKSEIKINGKYNDSLKLFPIVDAFIELQKGYVKSKDTPLYMDSIHLNAELVNSTGIVHDTRINLNHLTFLMDEEPFIMSGTIDNLSTYDYHFKVDGLVDLAKITQLYPVAGTTMSGTLNFDINTSGNLQEIELKEYDLLKTDGTLEMKDVKYKSKDVPFPVHIDDATFSFTPDKIVLNTFKGEFGKSNVSIAGHLYNYIPYFIKDDAFIKGDLRVNIDTMDLDEWFPHAISDEDESKEQNAKNNPKKVLVIPAGIDFTLDSDIKLVEFGKLDIFNLDGEIKIKDGILTLNETGFTMLDSKFAMSGDYNTKDTEHPHFDLDIDVEKLDINKAYQAFINPNDVAAAEGLFSTQYKLRGEVAPDFMPVYSTLAGSGKIFIDSVSVKGMKLFTHIKNVSKKDEFHNPDLNDIVMDTEIKDSKLVIYPFTFKVSKFMTEVEGSQTFDNIMDYSVKLSVPPLKRVKIPISITGSADKPLIKLGKGFSHEDFKKLD